MIRDLDGVYFRVRRDGSWKNICFTDLTPEEREEVCYDRSAEWYKTLAYHLADVIQNLGEEFDIISGD